MKLFFFSLFMVIFFSISEYACAVDYVRDSTASFKGTIALKNGNKIQAEDIHFFSDKITFYTSISRSLETVNADEVDYVRANAGNYVGEGLLIGALLGFSTYFGIVPWEYVSVDGVLISCAAGGFIGLIAGGLTSRERTYCHPNRFGITFNQIKINNEFTSNKITFTYKF